MRVRSKAETATGHEGLLGKEKPLRMYACARTHTYTPLNVHTYTRLHTCAYRSTNTGAHMYAHKAYLCRCGFMCTCTHRWLCIHTAHTAACTGAGGNSHVHPSRPQTGTQVHIHASIYAGAGVHMYTHVQVHAHTGQHIPSKRPLGLLPTRRGVQGH